MKIRDGQLIAIYSDVKFSKSISLCEESMKSLAEFKKMFTYLI